MATVGVAFVFLLAFMMSNFWGNAQSALASAQDEAIGYDRSMATARLIEAAVPRVGLVEPLGAYAESVRSVEWPLLQQADA